VLATKRTCWLLVGFKTESLRNIPSRSVALQVFALPFEHTGADLSSSWMMLARVLDILESAQRHVGVDKVRVALHELGPLMIARHGNGPAAKLLDSGVHLIGVALQDARKRVVRLLDLAHDNRLELASRVLKVEIRLLVLVRFELFGVSELALCR